MEIKFIGTKPIRKLTAVVYYISVLVIYLFVSCRKIKISFDNFLVRLQCEQK